MSIADELERLHNEARGYEFDLVPADGPIARLALFMHQNGDAVCAALRHEPPAEVAALVERLQSHMGKQDVSVLLADCRLAADALTTLDRQLTIARAKVAARDARIAEAGEVIAAIVSSASDTYKKRNGHLGSIEADDGEKCWIVHSDEIDAARTFLATHRNAEGGSDADTGEPRP